MFPFFFVTILLDNICSSFLIVFLLVLTTLSKAILHEQKSKAMAWTRQPQEQEGQKYFFNGRGLLTAGVQTLLSREEAIQIVEELQQLAIEKGGLDYLQVFLNENGERIWVIDQLDENMKKEPHGKNTN